MYWGWSFPGNKPFSDWIAGFWEMGLYCLLVFFSGTCVQRCGIEYWRSAISGKERVYTTVACLLLGIELCFLFVCVWRLERDRRGIAFLGENWIWFGGGLKWWNRSTFCCLRWALGWVSRLGLVWLLDRQWVDGQGWIARRTPLQKSRLSMSFCGRLWMEGKARSPLMNFLISSGNEIDEFFIPNDSLFAYVLLVLKSIWKFRGLVRENCIDI